MSPPVVIPGKGARLDALNQCEVLELVATGAPLEHVLDTLMRLIEERSPGMLCSILLLDADGRRLRHGAAPSLPAAYCSAVDGLVIGPCVGSCGTAAFKKEQVIVTDISTDVRWVEFRELACTHGLRACWSTPILTGDGRLLGTFAIYYRQPCGPSVEDRQLIAVTTHIAGIAIRRQQAENEIRQFNDALEKRVNERTAELAAANLELESFCYSVSHDLRAPLRHINGFVEILKRSLGPGLPAQSRGYLKIIAESADQMGTLIDDLLNFSRMGRLEMRFVEVDTANLVQLARNELWPDTVGREIEWQIGPMPKVLGDQAMLRQVFANLLANAVKYSRPRQSARIEVGCDGATDGEQVFFVRDNGVGFDNRYADQLFGVFQRLHRVEEFEGTGIGLANVRRIIDRHQGRTWAQGVEGAGATFYFSLPISTPGDDGKPAAQPNPS